MTLTGYDDSGSGDNLAGLKVTCNSISGWEFSLEVDGGSTYSGACSQTAAFVTLDPYITHTAKLYRRSAPTTARSSAITSGDGWDPVQSVTIPPAMSNCKISSVDRKNTVVCYDKRDEDAFRVCWATNAFSFTDGDGVTCEDFTRESIGVIRWYHTGLTNGTRYYYSVMAVNGDGGVSLPADQVWGAPATPPAPTCTGISVTANAPDVLNGADGSCSLREAIQNVNDGTNTYADCPNAGTYGTSDTICIPAGAYANAIAGTGEDNNAKGDLDILKSVAINGAGAGTTIIDGGGIDRVFDVDPLIAGGIVVRISGVGVQHGSAGGGGGIVNGNGTVSVTNSTVSGNSATATNGGGIFTWGGTVTVTNSTISGNSANNAGGSGGGIYNNHGTVTVTNSTISGNSASTGDGGGIHNNGGTLTVTNSTISGNSASTGGGGIYNIATLDVTNSTISGNSASTGDGGGIYHNSGTLTISNSTISGNSAASGGGIISFGTVTVTNSTISSNSTTGGGWGGGIYHNSGTLTISNSTISGNSTSGGGGIYNNTGTLDVTNSTISGNSTNGGGGIYNNTGTANITNVTITGNSATVSGGGIYNPGGSVFLKNTIVASQLGGGDCSGTITDNGNNLASDNTCSWTLGGTSLSNTNPQLDPLADNGGPTQTHALSNVSPAIDAGDTATCSSFTWDQRGSPYSRFNGACDIGAYEYQ